MSVFTSNIYVYEAPLGISEKKVVISGSWSSVSIASQYMDPSHVSHLRLHNWKQQYDSKTTLMCIDFVVKDKKPVILIKMKDNSFRQCLENDTFLSYTNEIIKKRSKTIWSIYTAIQQEQPGETAAASQLGSAGSVGTNQSK